MQLLRDKAKSMLLHLGEYGLSLTGGEAVMVVVMRTDAAK